MESKAVIFDSNVWIGYFNTADTTHAQAKAYFKKYNRKDIILTEYVLLEVATVLKQKIGSAATNKIITIVLQTENIKLLPSSEFFSATLAKFLESKDKNLSFVDVSLAVLSSDFTVVTFDKALEAEIKQINKISR